MFVVLDVLVVLEAPVAMIGLFWITEGGVLLGGTKPEDTGAV